jgi:quinol monooxygenase YgiN
MRFLYLAIHYPKPEHRQDLLQAMQALGLSMRTAKGMIEANAWFEQDEKRIVATSIWESATAFQQAAPMIGAAIKDVPFDEWEAPPRELLRLNEGA